MAGEDGASVTSTGLVSARGSGETRILAGVGNIIRCSGQLSGTLPEWLGDLPAVGYLGLWGNDFTGYLPASPGNLESPEVLYVHTLDLSGPLPRSLMDLDLYWFHWYWTDLRSPPDDEFQAWLETIRHHEGGSVCDQ